MSLNTSVTQQDEQNKKRGMVISISLHVLLIALALLPLLTFPDPPPGQAGILVNLGLPDEGQGNENAAPSEPIIEEQPVAPEEEVTPPPTPTKPKPEPEPKKNVVTTEDPSQVAIRKQKEKEQRERQAELERQQREEQERLDREARERAEREAKQREANALKDALSGGFGEGTGEGKGNTGTSGNQGDPGGDPNADRVTGISTGAGVVEGFGGRGVTRSYKPTDTSQEQGTAVIKACIDRNGNIVSAEFTQAGSTITSSRLKQIAVDGAKQWKFAPGNVDKQCGKIIFNFKFGK